MKIDLEELKRIEIKMLVEFHELCKKQGLRYSLAYGTLLGAVRHKGFIPWDDDVDVCMPRPDYEKLVAYCKKNDTPFTLLCSETDREYGYFYAKAMNPDTVIKDDKLKVSGGELGVFIDIFPVDGLGNTYKEAKKEYVRSGFKRRVLVASNWKKFFRSKTHAIYYEPIRFVFFLLSRFANKRKLICSMEKIYKKHNFEDTKYAGVIARADNKLEILESDIYGRYTTVIFEGAEFSAMENYDKYLTAFYGDYMKLPPEEKRVTHHTFEAYYK